MSIPSDLSKVLVSGSLVYERVWITGKALPTVLGGSGAYTAIAASRFANTCLTTVVGTSDLPVMRSFEACINLDLVEAPGRLMRWTGRYDDVGKSPRTEMAELGVLGSARRPNTLNIAAYVAVLTSEDPAYQLQLLSQISFRYLAVGLNENWLRVNQGTCLQLLKNAVIVSMNIEEYRSLPSVTKKECETKFLLITDGPRGTDVIHGVNSFHHPAPSIEQSMVVDPSGAGDVLLGAVCGALAKGRSECSWEEINKGVCSAQAVIQQKLLSHGAIDFCERKRVG